MPGTTRIQMELTDDELQAIDRIGALAGFQTKKEVVLNAITLLRWAVREIMYGKLCTGGWSAQPIEKLASLTKSNCQRYQS
jgi:hypothetical protein